MPFPFLAAGTVGGKLMSAGKIGLSIASMFGGGGRTAAQTAAITAQNQAMSKWFSDVNQHDNKGAALKISEAARRVGFSRAKSDIMRSTLQGVGMSFSDMQKIQVEAGSKLTGGFAKLGESTARTAGRSAAMAIYSKKAAVYKKLADLGEATAIARQGAIRQYQNSIKWHEGAPAYHKIPYPKGPSTLSQITGAIGKFSSTYSSLGKLGGSLSKLGSDFGSLFGGGSKLIQDPFGTDAIYGGTTTEWNTDM